MKLSQTIPCVSAAMIQQEDDGAAAAGAAATMATDGHGRIINRSVSFDRRAWARVEARSLDGGAGSLSVVRYDPAAALDPSSQLPLYDRLRTWLTGAVAPGQQSAGHPHNTYNQLPVVSKVSFKIDPAHLTMECV